MHVGTNLKTQLYLSGEALTCVHTKMHECNTGLLCKSYFIVNGHFCHGFGTENQGNHDLCNGNNKLKNGFELYKLNVCKKHYPTYHL